MFLQSLFSRSQLKLCVCFGGCGLGLCCDFWEVKVRVQGIRLNLRRQNHPNTTQNLHPELRSLNPMTALAAVLYVSFRGVVFS